MGLNEMLVMAGGAAGAVCRFAFTIKMKRMISTEFPLATFLINGIGSFLLGFLISVCPVLSVQLLLGTGFMGGFTTFSTFQLENITLLRRRFFGVMLLNMFLSTVLCILLAWIGFQAGNGWQ